jgi:O-antigen/teichoic acid export membrane protein
MTTEASEIELGAEVSKGVLAQFAMAAVGFVGTIIFARVLGPTSFGGFYLLMLVVKVLNRPGVGWSTATKKRYSESRSPKDEIIGAQVLISAVLIVVSGALLWTFRGVLSDYTGLEDPVLPGIAILATILVFSPFQSVISATGRESLVKWIDTTRSFFTFPLQLGFVLLGFGAAGMAYGLAGATFFSIPITLSFLSVSVAVPTRKTFRSLWEYAKYSIPDASVGMAYSQYDVFLLGLVLSPAVVAHYQVAYNLSMPATYVATVLSPSIMARVSNLASKQADVEEDVSNSLAFVSVLAIPIFFGALALSTDIVVTVYGPDYRAGAILLVGLAFYQIVNTQNDILKETLRGLDMPDVAMRVSAGTLAFNVVVGLALVFEFGAAGVVLATVLSGVLRYVLFRYRLRRAREAITFFPRPLYHQAFAGLVMFGVVALVGSQVKIASWLHLSAVVGLGAVVYFAVFGLVDRRFRHTISAVTSDLVAQVGDIYTRT